MNYQKIVFATNNAHKLAEIREMLAGTGIEVQSLADIGCHEDIPETSATIEGNARQKAEYIYNKYGACCFADRRAQFRTVIALTQGGDGGTIEFEGIVTGEITRKRRGGEGFGYDPIFRPDGYAETFAEMGHEEKNKISHRARAVAKLVEYLTK